MAGVALITTLFVCHLSNRLVAASENYVCFNSDEHQANFADLLRYAAYLHIPASYDACINKLRQIDAATEQWVLEAGKLPDDKVTWEDITPYLGRSSKLGGRPRCPHGGAYILRTVKDSPYCTVPGHALAE